VSAVAEIAVRFAMGGLVISLFALLGEVFQPKTFAGIFGAAPSVALVSLAIAFSSHGPSYAATECRTMVYGAVALAVYGIACAAMIRRRSVRVSIGAGICLLVWFATAFSLWIAFAPS
jgi:uncharacterized membrane protein (GlpM family)